VATFKFVLYRGAHLHELRKVVGTKVVGTKIMGTSVRF
jgi:hypothetical protein